MMIGNGQWVTTRDRASVELFLADIRMRESLEQQWAQERRKFWRGLWMQIRELVHPAF